MPCQISHRCLRLLFAVSLFFTCTFVPDVPLALAGPVDPDPGSSDAELTPPYVPTQPRDPSPPFDFRYLEDPLVNTFNLEIERRYPQYGIATYDREFADVLQEFDVRQQVGVDSARYGRAMAYAEEMHPWKFGPDGTGRDPVESLLDYTIDSAFAIGVPVPGSPYDPVQSFNNFLVCFEPRLIKFICTWCWPLEIRVWEGLFDCPLEDNTGETWEYWWPEAEVDLNNFGIAALNPAVPWGEIDLTWERLSFTLETVFGDLYLVPYLKAYWGGDMDFAYDWEDPLPNNIDRILDGEAPPEGPGEPVLDTIKKYMQRFEEEYGVRAWGHTHWSPPIGLPIGSQLTQQEAHVYRTKVNHLNTLDRPEDDGEFWFRAEEVKLGFITLCIPFPFWFNGYELGTEENCWYNTNPEPTESEDANPIRMWTEDIQYRPYWEFEEFSSSLPNDGKNEPEHEATLWYQKAAPPWIALAGGAFSLPSSPIPDISPVFSNVLPQGPNYQDEFLALHSVNLEWLLAANCMSFRAEMWADPFADLGPALTPSAFNAASLPIAHAGVVPCCADDHVLQHICFREAELFPTIGKLSGAYPDVIMGAYFTRRALEIIGRLDNQDNRDYPDRGIQIFADWEEDNYPNGLDKLQRIHPAPHGHCFHTLDEPANDWINELYREDEHVANPLVIDSGGPPWFPSDETGFEPGPPPNMFGTIRHVYWNKRMACTCPYRGCHEPSDDWAYALFEIPICEIGFIPWGYGCQWYTCQFDVDDPASVPLSLACEGLPFNDDWDRGQGDYIHQPIQGLAIPPAVMWETFARSAAYLYPWHTFDALMGVSFPGAPATPPPPPPTAASPALPVTTVGETLDGELAPNEAILLPAGTFTDTDGDGFADLGVDADGDGVADLPDFNGDGTPDALLVDADGDGIQDPIVIYSEDRFDGTLPPGAVIIPNSSGPDNVLVPGPPLVGPEGGYILPIDASSPGSTQDLGITPDGVVIFAEVDSGDFVYDNAGVPTDVCGAASECGVIIVTGGTPPPGAIPIVSSGSTPTDPLTQVTTPTDFGFDIVGQAAPLPPAVDSGVDSGASDSGGVDSGGVDAGGTDSGGVDPGGSDPVGSEPVEAPDPGP